MGRNGTGREKRDGASRRAKEGARTSLPGLYLPTTFFLMKGQLWQLDQLAMAIRELRGKWITRSGILTAIIEASLQAAARSDAEGAAEGSAGE